MSATSTTVPGDKTICLPIADSIDCEQLVRDRKAFRQYPTQQIALHPELFPAEIADVYRFHGFRTSAKLGCVTRRIRLIANSAAYQLRPDFVMPYMIGKTDEVEKGLYLRKFGVPFEAIAYVMGKDPMYWYRASQALGRPSIVGTSIKDGEAIPPSSVRG